MTENKRFIIDDVGTLIDIQTRNTYDYVSDVCPLLNALNEENEQLKHDATVLIQANQDYRKENEQLKLELGKLNILYKAKCKTEEQLIKMGKEVEKENEQLKKENQRMTDKLNELALEFLNYDMVTMGKATEISEMCYYDFLKYRKDNGNPMELQL